MRLVLIALQIGLVATLAVHGALANADDTTDCTTPVSKSEAACDA